MMTYQEFKDLGGFDGVAESDFDTLMKSAKRRVDRLVGYDAVDQHDRGFLSDFAFSNYQNAVVAQIEYEHFVGPKAVAGVKAVSDVSVGNFSYKDGTAETSQYSTEVFDYLSTGGFMGGAVSVYGD